MIIELAAEVGIGQSITIGDRVMLGTIEIAADRSRDAPAGHRQLAGICKCDLPIARVVDAVHLDGVGLQLDRDVAVPRIKIQKIVADDLALVSHAKHKSTKTEA